MLECCFSGQCSGLFTLKQVCKSPTSCTVDNPNALWSWRPCKGSIFTRMNRSWTISLRDWAQTSIITKGHLLGRVLIIDQHIYWEQCKGNVLHYLCLGCILFLAHILASPFNKSHDFWYYPHCPTTPHWIGHWPKMPRVWKQKASLPNSSKSANIISAPS